MKTATALLALALMLPGCIAEVPTDAPESSQENPDHRRPWEDCDRDTGIVHDAAGNVVAGMDQCAIRTRFREIYERRADELGCRAPFPWWAARDEGLTDCDVELVEEWTHDADWALDCRSLWRHFANPRTYAGFHCGPNCETTVDHNLECCPGTPYELRAWHRCPYWCDGLSQCNADAECEALLEERGPRSSFAAR
ncbi:MAG TPA: hypothetical protein ENK57_26455 [Polyangiaceae bacterium]|nr:hypothetical protein [Polyangiaceae bacterium]